jgi:outer membrane protein OmpA-like peptidoglycan-associated protein
MSPRLAPATMLAALALCAGPAQAQSTLPTDNGETQINVQVFRPSPHEGDLLSTMGSHVYEHLRWTVSAMLNFGKNPLVFVDKSSGTERRHEVIQNQLTLDLMGSLSLFQWVDLGLVLPVHLVNSGDSAGFAAPSSSVASFAMGDIRLSPKLKLINRDDDISDGFGLAMNFELGFPTGSPGAFVSDGFTFVPSLIADYKLGPAHLAANLGARIRGPGSERYSFLEVGHEFVWRAGASYDVLEEQLQVVGEIYGASSDFTTNATYLEGVIGGRYHFADEGVTLTLGGGSGFTKGYGNTKFRLFAGFSYAEPIVRDADGDGILDEADKCPTEPEDKDGFEDDDGCPEDDNDKDGIKDASDRCPNDPEDQDGFEDEDGCPELDNDGDGIEDTSDKCPLVAEDKDGFQDDDGCPEPDNDGDGIPDVEDKCPNEPEVVNGFQDEDGCPDETKAKLEKGRIVILDKVFFDLNKSSIKVESHQLLKDVAGILRSNPHIKKVRVEGHTDDQGPDKWNLKLSQKRSESVRQFLIEQGIDGARLEATGRGETAPLMVGRTAEAREKNRRVEFIITDQ